MGAYFMNDSGAKSLIQMGCYGIGVGRLLATVVETHHDAKGMVWPENLSPFAAHVVVLQPSLMGSATPRVARWAEAGDILLDNRALSVGEKLNDADLIGVTTRIIISEKNEAKQQVEVQLRGTKEIQHISYDAFEQRWLTKGSL
jgi:prolyl-tRNA synthetase